MPLTTTTYVGNGAFEDMYEPVSGKSEWGMDTLTRVMAGKQTSLVSFVNGLNQGDTYSYHGNTYYLQSWEPDNDPVFPKIRMEYKGLFDGIPDPFVSGRTVEQSCSQTTADPVTITYWDAATQSSVTGDVMGTRTSRYITRESTYRYITSSRPSSPTYTALDVAMAIIYLQSEITTDVGANFASNAPAALATALFPSAYLEYTTDTNPVFGTPFFENTDCVIQYST